MLRKTEGQVLAAGAHYSHPTIIHWTSSHSLAYTPQTLPQNGSLGI